MPTWTTAAVAAAQPAPASIAASIGTMSGNYEDEPPHLFATASDGEAFVKTQCQELRRDAAVLLFCQSLASVLSKPLYLCLMLRFIGVKELDIVCLVSPFLIGPCTLTLQYILLLDGVTLF